MYALRRVAASWADHGHQYVMRTMAFRSQKRVPQLKLGIYPAEL